MTKVMARDRRQVVLMLVPVEFQQDTKAKSVRSIRAPHICQGLKERDQRRLRLRHQLTQRRLSRRGWLDPFCLALEAS